MGFSPLFHNDLPPLYECPQVIPDPNIMRATIGHPRTIRIRNTMDETDHNCPKRCGMCFQVILEDNVPISQVLLVLMKGAMHSRLPLSC
ncbi:hypothetical protein Ahy_B10g105563 [Arachis hypogaea]|uniref:Uncharacterized protein n=1 Tax=Arachis hypogaea TaxID=3818 RepID=A0A444X8A8_ARAHY|nr:hypothetical protein Ahy_B10g105563 [Arachis hypogaea]